MGGREWDTYSSYWQVEKEYGEWMMVDSIDLLHSHKPFLLHIDHRRNNQRRLVDHRGKHLQGYTQWMEGERNTLRGTDDGSEMAQHRSLTHERPAPHSPLIQADAAPVPSGHPPIKGERGAGRREALTLTAGRREGGEERRTYA